MITYQIEKIFNKRYFLAESPIQISKNCLSWIDVYNKNLIFLDLLNYKINVKSFDQHIGFLVKKKDYLIIGLQNKIINFSLKKKKSIVSFKFNNEKKMRTNDGFIDDYGNLWFGILDEKKKNRGGLYCKYKYKKKIIKIFGNINTPNGPVFASKKIFFFNDTSRSITYRCQIKSDNIIKKKFKSFQKNLKPDGMFVDKKKKRLWICFFGNSMIKCFSLKGKLLNFIKLKAKNVTNCTLDNYRKNTLYITTAYKNLKGKNFRRTYDGKIFRVNNKFI